MRIKLTQTRRIFLKMAEKINRPVSTILLFTFMLALLTSCKSSNNRVVQKIGEANSSNNPLLAEFNTPYQVPPFEKIKPSDYLPAFKAEIEQQNRKINTIITNKEKPTFKNTIESLELSSKGLNRISNIFLNIKSANTNDSIKQVAKQVAPLLTAHEDSIKLNSKLFDKIKYVYDNKNKENLSTEQSTVLKKYFDEFVRGGANLSNDKKEDLKKINLQLALLYLKFGDNVLADTNDFKMFIKDKKKLAGLPKTVVTSAAEAAEIAGHKGEWLFTTQKSSMLPFLQFSDNRELRKKLMTAYHNTANNNNEHDNKKIISAIVSLRTKKAHILGYKNFASYVIADNMAKTPEKAFELTSKVYTAGLKKAEEEKIELQNIINKEGNDFELQPWDWSYYAEKIRKNKYGLDADKISQYFTLDNVVKGMFYCANKLYGLSFKELKNIPKPHPDAHAYEVLDKNGEVVGILYQDFYARKSKRAGAWMEAYRKQSNIDKKILPVITMVCNFSKPSKNSPTLLTPDEVTTAFHEFGHSLHGLLSECRYPKTSGTAVPSDYVELPSQFMENWAFQPEVLKHYAFNYKTGKVIPMSYIEKLEKASTFNHGFVTAEAQSGALLDLAYHTRESEEPIKDIEKFEKETLNKIGLIPEITVRYKSPYFSHIFSSEEYAAGYYVYNWAEVLDADAFESFKETGDIFDPDKAMLFKKWVLTKGGSGDVMKYYKKFRGKEPTTDALLTRNGLK